MADDFSRRPLRSRSIPAFGRIAATLAQWGVSPNAISAAGLGFGVLAGALLFSTNLVGDWARVAVWVLAAIAIQARLLCNMLDGMVAIEGGLKSRTGPIWNELPDRVADGAALIGAGLAVGGIPWLGWLAASLALMTAYVRAIGASNGAGEAFLGVMSKPKRMFCLTVACGLAAVGFPGVAMPLVLGFVVVGCVVTCVQRLCWIGGRLPG